MGKQIIRLTLKGGKIAGQETIGARKIGKIERSGKKLQDMWDNLNAPIDWNPYGINK